jgi:hypothetical protein
MKNREGLRRYRVMVLAAVMIMVIVFQVLPSHYLTDHHMFYYKFYSGI